VNAQQVILCKRCGRCCLTDLIAYVTDEDRERWKREGRQDVLDLLERESALWAGDRIVSSKDGRAFQGCPFVLWEGELATCTIYETRPRVCRNFEPGSSELCSQFTAGFSTK
jgi:Fe-S-cluster containining protein